MAIWGYSKCLRGSICNFNYCVYISNEFKQLLHVLKDEKLKKLVEQHGTEDWKIIANFLPVSTTYNGVLV